MNRHVVAGIDGSNPLGFLAALGLIRVAASTNPSGRLGFTQDGLFNPIVHGPWGDSELAELVAKDAELAAGTPTWRLTYAKTEKRGTKAVADLKAPPDEFRKYLARCIDGWRKGDAESAACAAAFGTDIAVDGNGNTKPTAFHFTAANQQFLGTVESIRASLSRDWIQASLFVGHGDKPGSNLRWDPAAERNWALCANNPNEDGTRVNAPLEWLAFRGLPLLPSFPRGSRIITTAVRGRGEEMVFTWPLWSPPASVHSVRSALVLDWGRGVQERAARGVFAVCKSAIKRTNQGFGNFSPAEIMC